MRCNSHQGHAGNVSARTSQAGNYPGLDWVARKYYDRDISCSLLRRQRAGDVQRHDDIDLESDKLGREPRKLIQLSFRRAKLEANVLPLYVANFAHSFAEFLLERIRIRDSYVKRAYPNYPRLLPAPDERRGKSSGQRGQQEPAAVHYSIT